MADPSGHAVYGVGLLLLACWDCGFESDLRLKYVSCDCCVLSGRGLCVGLIINPERSYRVFMCVCMCLCVCVCECRNVIVKPRL